MMERDAAEFVWRVAINAAVLSLVAIVAGRAMVRFARYIWWRVQ